MSDALRDALEKIEHNGCSEDAHIARQALEDAATHPAPVEAPSSTDRVPVAAESIAVDTASYDALRLQGAQGLREALETVTRKAAWWIRELRDNPKPSWTVLTEVVTEIESISAAALALPTKGEPK